MSFRRGDIVQRNSGGPSMLIEEVEDDNGEVVRCRWYENRKRREGSFFVEGLRHFLVQASSSPIG